MVMSFSDEILRLDQKDLRVQGFMTALGTGQEQTHFLLSAVPSSCPFCVPAVAYEIVEVISKKPVTYGFDPIIVAGKLSVEPVPVELNLMQPAISLGWSGR